MSQTNIIWTIVLVSLALAMVISLSPVYAYDQNGEEIIVITDASHLDQDKTSITNIFDSVKEMDGVWSEPVKSGEYVRVKFEKELTSRNDITIYPRTIEGTPKIEVYEKDGAEVIAQFTQINDNDYNKIYLTSFEGAQDTFDLKVIGGTVEFDYITDPYRKINFTTSGTWTVPKGVSYNIMIEAWAGGGGGGGSGTNTVGGSGGAGGQYARKNFSVNPGQSYSYAIAAGGTAGAAGNNAGGKGGNTTFNSTSVRAVGGNGGAGNAGAAGTGSTTNGIGDTVYAGGNGAIGGTYGSPGGGGAGSTGSGNSATAGTPGTPGAAKTELGGAGGAGNQNAAGGAGSVFGGAGGGGERSGGTSMAGGAGAAGLLRITFFNDTTKPTVTLRKPAAGYINTTTHNTQFNCSVTDDYYLKNISLYITNNRNTSFRYNKTKSISGTSSSANWTLPLSNGNYTWNCLSFDSGGLSSWSSVNRSLKIDVTSTCTPPGSGNWNVNCADNCIWTSKLSVPKNITIQGTGTLQLNATMNFTSSKQYMFIYSGCQIWIGKNGEII